ncbi:MAG: 50S ribosomal protein L21 [bacterium]
MYAIVRTGGKQYKVKPGDKFTVEKLTGDKGGSIGIEDVLLISEENDSEPVIGKPVISGAKVDCEIVSQARAKKVIVFKFKKRKRYMRNKGHRQHLTMLKVKSISYGDKNWVMEESK